MPSDAYMRQLTVIGSDNGLSPPRRQAIIWTNAGILLIQPLGTKFSEILIEIYTFSFKKMHFKMSSAKWRSFCLGLNVLTNFNANPWSRCSGIRTMLTCSYVAWLPYIIYQFVLPFAAHANYPASQPSHMHEVLDWISWPGPWFNIKISSYQYGKSYCGDKTVVR